MVTGSSRGAPVHWMSWVGIAVSVVAGVLALYGSVHAEKHLPNSPLREARGPSMLPARPADYQPFGDFVDQRVKEESDQGGSKAAAWTSAAATWVYRYGRNETDRYVLAKTGQSKIAKYTLQLVAYVLPFFLGLAGALTGGWAMKVVQASGGKYVGNTLAVFAMMTGGLATVVAFCMMMGLYVWPHVPSLYTT